MADIRAGNVVIRPSTGARVSWTPIEPVADEYDAAKELAAKGYSCLGVIGNASHLRGSGGHTPWCTEGYQGIACKAGRIYAIDLHAPDMADLEIWLIPRLRQGYYRWVFYLNINGRQWTRVNGFAKAYTSGDQHLHLSGLAGHEADNSSILRDWDTHLTAPVLINTALSTKTSTGDDMASVPQDQWDRARKQLDAISDTVGGGTGSAYRDSVLRKDHGFQIDEIDRRIKAHVDEQLARVEARITAKLDALVVALAGGQPPAAGV